MTAVINLAGSIDPSLSKVINDVQKKTKGINVKALAAGAAVGGIAIATGKAVAKAGAYLKDLGSAFDGATDAIRIGTGATGEALDALLADFDEVYKSVPTTMEDASQAIADYNTRLGLTGEDLQDISKQALQVSDMLGEDLDGVIEGSSQAFQQWKVDTDNMGSAMDYIFKVSQSTGTGFTDLMKNMQTFGPQLQDMGYSFEEASALMGQMEKAGVNTEEVLGAMKKSVTTLAKEGISAGDGLKMYYEQIQNAGSAAEAASIASEIFGTRAGSTMASAIRDGTLAVGDFMAELSASDETIARAAEDTYDFAERLQIMKQGLEVALKPMANTVFDGLNAFMPTLQALMEKMAPTIARTVEAATPFVEDFLMGAAGLLEEVVPMVADLGEELLPVIMILVSDLLPPLLGLTKGLIPPVVEIVKALLPPLAGILSKVLPIITGLANLVLPALAEMIVGLLPILQPILDILFMLIDTVIMPILPMLTDIIQSLLPAFIALTTALLPSLTPLLEVLTPIAEVLAAVVGWLGKIVGWVADGLTWVVDLIFGGEDVDLPEGYATGGFTNGLSIAGEDPNYPTEAVISFNPAYRSQNLAYWAQAGRMLGATSDSDYTSLSGGSGTSVVYDLSGLSFSPNITIEGDADEDSLIQKLRDMAPEFIDFVLSEIQKREEGAYVTADSRLY